MKEYGPFELRDGENLLSLRDICYSPEDARISPYNTVFQAKVVSEGFSGLGEFECDWTEFLRFVSELNELYNFERSEVEINDIEWGNRLGFSMDHSGRLTISGYLDVSIQTLEFEFQTDQTALALFLRQIIKQLGTR